MKSFKKLEDNYWSIITNEHWFYIDPANNVINHASGKWNNDKTIFTFDRGPKLDLNHIFIK